MHRLKAIERKILTENETAKIVVDSAFQIHKRLGPGGQDIRISGDQVIRRSGGREIRKSGGREIRWSVGVI